MFGKFLLISGFIFLTPSFCKADNSGLPEMVVKRDTIVKTKSTTRINNNKISNSNFIRLLRQDSIYAINMQKEYLESQSPGYISPETIASEARTKLAEELVKDGIVDKQSRFTYQTNDTAFIVNGKKQPQSVFEKYKPIIMATSRHSAKYDYMRNHIIVKMIQDNLIGNDNWAVINLSYELNDNEFIINGQKQPYNVFQKYYKEFVKQMPGMRWKYESHFVKKIMPNSALK